MLLDAAVGAAKEEEGVLLRVVEDQRGGLGQLGPGLTGVAASRAAAA